MARFLWTQKQDIGPSPRAHSGIAYDSARKLTYLFGGAASPQGNWTLYGDSWAWDGRYWSQVARFGPSARLGHTMTFDAARINTVVFGGEPVAGDSLRDTWVFDGAEWTQVEDIGPSPRTRHAATFDSIRQRVVVFGGVQNIGGTKTFVNDTWEWDGQSWTQMEANGPGPRSDHVMAFDSIRNRTVLFGGGVAGAGGAIQPLGDTWEWNGDNWTEVSDIGPGPRNLAAMTSAGGAVILHGGALGDLMGDTWQWVGGGWSKVQEMGPSPRGAHALAYDSDRQRVVLFGGESNEPGAGYLGDTWEAPGVPAPVAGGPGPDNLVVSPSTISLSQGPAPVIQFDTAPSNSTRYILIYLINVAGQRVPIDEALLPPGQTHVAHQVPPNRLSMGMNQLGLIAPVDAAFSTELGSSFAVFHIAV
jgi:hypothetical protein